MGRVPHEDFQQAPYLWRRGLAPATRRRYRDVMFGINAAEVAVLLGVLVAMALGLFLIVKLAVRQGSK